MVRNDVSYSGTETDSSSDDEIDECVEIALKSMKKSLSDSGSQKSQTESRTAEFIKTTHQKIYDTFDSDDDSDDTEENAVVPSKDEKVGNVEIPSLFDTFVIDKGGANQEQTSDIPTEVFTIDMSGLEDGSDSEKKDVEKNDKKSKKKTKKKKLNPELSSSLHVSTDVNDVYINPQPSMKQNKDKDHKKEKTAEPEIMKRCVLNDEYERQSTIQTEKSKRHEKKMRRLEREKTKGSKWFNMPAQEVTEERKNDFLVYQMRKAADPKRFYKNNDGAGIPKYYQMGTVVEHAADFYDSRIPKKQRKANMVEELLADAKFRQFNKRKFTEIQEAKRAGAGPYSMMKKLKKKKVK